MHRWILLGALAAATACGDDDDGRDVASDTAADADADAGPDADADAETGPDVEADGGPDAEDVPMDGPGACPSHGYVLREGENAGFVVDDHDRSFVLRLPDAVDTAPGPWPVVFLYHGYGNEPSQVLDLVEDLVDDAEFPFLAVAPDSVPLALTSSPMGFEYDILLWNSEQNLDLDLFDELLACLDEAYDVDEDRIYVMGFSAGGIMTNFLADARPDVFAAAASFSGTTFADPDQALCFGSLCTTWPPYAATANKTAMLIVWGGETDTYEAMPGLLTVDFNMHALASIAWWTGHGHNVVGCNHGLGHELPPDLSGPQFLRFFRDHPKGVSPDPYATALPPDFPAYCTFHPAE